jgi:hypothetical protein
MTQGETAVINMAAHIANRARTVEVQQNILAVLSEQMVQWRASGHFAKVQNIKEAVLYVETHLGKHGQWKGMLGDHRGTGANGTFDVTTWSTSNSANESQWAMYDRALLNGYRNASQWFLSAAFHVEQRQPAAAGTGEKTQ